MMEGKIGQSIVLAEDELYIVSVTNHACILLYHILLDCGMRKLTDQATKL